MPINQYANIIIPGKDELEKIALERYPTGHREEVQRGTNCSGEILNYIKEGKNVRLFVKKSFLKGDIEKFETEYKLIKSKFKNIVPNQGFIAIGGNIFAFCAPIAVKIDVLSDKNRAYLIETLKANPKLIKQFKFFIKIFEEFLAQGLTLDLFGNENLVISDDNKLYYLDSFLVFHQSPSIQTGSIKNLGFLKKLIEELEQS